MKDKRDARIAYLESIKPPYGSEEIHAWRLKRFNLFHEYEVTIDRPQVEETITYYSDMEAWIKEYNVDVVYRPDFPYDRRLVNTRIMRFTYLFRNKKDAMLFKLTWS
jgi:hypothetical protein